MPRPKKETVIMVNNPPPDPLRYNPALGTVDRLLKQSLLETQSLTVVRGMMLREQEQKAVANGDTKFRQAIGIRNANGNGHTTRELPPAVGNKKLRGPRGSGNWARTKEENAKKQICGPRLMLFILEHLDDHDVRGNTWMMNELHNTGKAGHIKRLSGVWGQLTTPGYVENRGDGYRRTSKGRHHALKLREDLEATGACIRGQYIAPEDYTTKKPRRQSTH